MHFRAFILNSEERILKVAYTYQIWKLSIAKQTNANAVLAPIPIRFSYAQFSQPATELRFSYAQLSRPVTELPVNQQVEDRSKHLPKMKSLCVTL